MRVQISLAVPPTLFKFCRVRDEFVLSSGTDDPRPRRHQPRSAEILAMIIPTTCVLSTRTSKYYIIIWYYAKSFAPECRPSPKNYFVVLYFTILLHLGTYICNLYVIYIYICIYVYRIIIFFFFFTYDMRSKERFVITFLKRAAVTPTNRFCDYDNDS